MRLARGFPRVEPTMSPYTDYQMEAARAENNTYRPAVLYGEAPLLGLVEQDIQPQGGITVLPLVAGELTVVSSDANDTFAGSGLEALAVQGLDGQYGNGGLAETKPFYEEVILLNGITPVPASIDLLRAIFAVGILGNSIGTITIAIAGVTQIVILPDTAFSTSMRLTVPMGWTGYGHGFTSLWSAANPVGFTLYQEIEATVTGTLPLPVNENSTRIHLGALGFPQRTDITFRARRLAGGGTDRLAAASDGWLERD